LLIFFQKAAKFYFGKDFEMADVVSNVGAAATDDVAAFDYGAEAELFPTRSRKSTRRPIGYKRFARAADAIRFAIEDLPPEFLVGAYLEVDEERFDVGAMRRLYDNPRFPLARRAVRA
jgi:hypothetical protein